MSSESNVAVEQQSNVRRPQKPQETRVSNTSRRFEQKMTHYAKNSRITKSKQQELYETIAGLRQELRHANDRLQAAQDRLAKSSEAEDQSVDAQRNAEHVRDLALEDRRSALANLSDRGGILQDLRSLGQRLEAGLPHEQAAAERLPLPTPGRLNGNPQGMTIHLLKSTATVIIDGYNVTKGTWPDRSLEQQRELLDCRHRATRSTLRHAPHHRLTGPTSRAPIE